MSTLNCTAAHLIPTRQPSSGQTRRDSDTAAVRFDVVKRAKEKLERGFFDNPEAIERKLDACLDRVWADVFQNTPR